MQLFVRNREIQTYRERDEREKEEESFGGISITFGLVRKLVGILSSKKLAPKNVYNINVEKDLKQTYVERDLGKATKVEKDLKQANNS